MNDPLLWIGIFGSALILIAFSANKLNWWSDRSWQYDVCNILGAAALSYYSYVIESIPFVVLNIVWLVMACKDVFSRSLQATKQ